MDEKDEQFLRGLYVCLIVAVITAIWGAYEHWWPEQVSAPIRSLVPPIIGGLAALLVVVFASRIVLRSRRKKRQLRNTIFASFMGQNWDGKEGVKVSTNRRGEVTKLVLTLPPTAPLYDGKYQEKLTAAAKGRMGTDLISTEPDLGKHTITFKPLSQTERREEAIARADEQLTAAFSYFFPSDWDKRSGVTWGIDPTVKATAPHGYNTVKIAVPGKWSLADEDVRKRIRTIAETKLASTDLTESYDAVRNTAEFAVFTVTADIAAERTQEQKVRALEEDFRGFFAKPVTATVTEWDEETGDPLAFTLRYEPQRGDYQESFAKRLEQGARVKLERRMAVTVRPKTREVFFEPRAELATYIEHPGVALYEGHKDARTLLHLGENILGEISSWELSANGAQPHAIFAGPSRSGKSSAMRNLILGCAYWGIEVLCLDPKYKEFLAWQSFANVRSVATETEMIMEGIEYVHAIMDTRYKAGAAAKRAGQPEPKFSPILIIIDEFIVLQRDIKVLWKSIRDTKVDPAEAPAISMIEDLLVKAAGANIHLCIGMQRMDVTFLSGAAKDQATFRLALGQMSSTLANMAFGDFFAAEGIPSKQGRGLINPDNINAEVQVFKIDEPTNEDTRDQEILRVFKAIAAEHEKTADWSIPYGKFDSHYDMQPNPALERAAAEAKNPPPPMDAPAKPALINDLLIPAVSTSVDQIQVNDTIRNVHGEIGIVTHVEAVEEGDEYGWEITAMFGNDLKTEIFTEDSVIDRVDVIPEENVEQPA